MPLKAVNAVAALKTWEWWLKGCLVYLHTDKNTAAATFQLRRGRDSYIQACAWELWFICAHADITLAVSHMPGESLTKTADALSRFNMGQLFKSLVQRLVPQGVQLINPGLKPFHLSDDL